MQSYNPEYVLILSGDHIYKMDYEVMLDYHKASHADVTIAAMPVPMEEASRFGVVITDENGKIQEFEEKPEHPRTVSYTHLLTSAEVPLLKKMLSILYDTRVERPACMSLLIGRCQVLRLVQPFVYRGGLRECAARSLSLIHI